MERFIEALEFAAAVHKDQRRKGSGGSPYINHLIEVASLLSRVAKVNDMDVLVAAVLHDTLEDTEATEDEIESRFGAKVLQYVKKLTDDKSLPLAERREKQLATVSNSSEPIKLIKLADHCSNIASIPPSWSKERSVSYISWSFEVAKSCYSVSNELAEVYKERYEEAKAKASERLA